MAGRLDQAIGTVDGVNLDFATASAYAPGTLVVFLNGRQLKRELDNGWEETDPAAGEFRMKIAPVGPQFGADDPGDLIYAFWQTDNVSIGGADGGVPQMIAATHLRPELVGGLERAPRIAGSVDLEGSIESPVLSASEVRPEVVEADELRPKMSGAKEV